MRVSDGRRVGIQGMVWRVGGGERARVSRYKMSKRAMVMELMSATTLRACRFGSQVIKGSICDALDGREVMCCCVELRNIGSVWD
jgi:hypothetical protein